MISIKEKQIDRQLRNNNSHRNIGLDFFRLFCMFLITSIHLGYTNISLISTSNIHNIGSLYFLQTFQAVGINGFMLISAYFLSAKSFSIKRIISFWMQLLFCSVLIFVLITIVTRSFSIKNCVKSFLPVLTQHYWYPVVYIIILFAAPFMNRLIDVLSKKQLLLFLGFLFCTQILLLSTDFFYDSHVYLGHPSHSILGFVFLYFIAAYIRKYGINRRILFGPILLICIFIVSFGIRVLMNYVPIHIPNRLQIFEENGLFALLLSVSSFVTFSMVNIKNTIVNRIISFCSPSLFFVYLIQEHNSFRELFWSWFVCIENYINNPILLTIIAFSLFLVMAIILFQFYKLMKRICLSKVETMVCSKLNFVEKQ